jgi:hypothetical protein
MTQSLLFELVRKNDCLVFCLQKIKIFDKTCAMNLCEVFLRIFFMFKKCFKVN